jgi:DNA-directed RNA polymerase subunit RPC12/RpoP
MLTTSGSTCEECGNNFTLTYDDDVTDDSPGFCPFCGEKIFLNADFEYLLDDDVELDEELDS